MIWLNILFYATVSCVVLFDARIHFGGYWLTKQPGEPAQPGQRFHIQFFYTLWIQSIILLINHVLCLHVCLGSRAKLPE